MDTIAQLIVRIGADARELDRELVKAERRIRRWGDNVARTGQAMSLAITAPIAAVGAAAGKMAIDAVESENLFAVSMGAMADDARRWSQELRDQLGLNSIEVRKSLGTFNVMLSSMGLAEQAAYDMAKGLTKLAYDMASFYNLKPEEAFEKLQSGISGEVEPLKRLGIIVNETTAKTYAYANGIARQGEELTEQQKVLARYGAIMQQTSAAQGDLARTIDSPSNQLRILKARASELAIEFGQVLIPVIQRSVGFFEGIIKWLGGFDASGKKAIITIAGIAASIGPLLILIGKVPAVFLAAASGVKALSGALTFLAVNPEVLAVVVVIGAIAGAMAMLRRETFDATKALEKQRDVLEDIEKRKAAGTAIAVSESEMKLLKSKADQAHRWFLDLSKLQDMSNEYPALKYDEVKGEIPERIKQAYTPEQLRIILEDKGWGGLGVRQGMSEQVEKARADWRTAQEALSSAGYNPAGQLKPGFKPYQAPSQTPSTPAQADAAEAGKEQVDIAASTGKRILDIAIDTLRKWGAINDAETQGFESAQVKRLQIAATTNKDLLESAKLTYQADMAEATNTYNRGWRELDKLGKAGEPVYGRWLQLAAEYQEAKIGIKQRYDDKEAAINAKIDKDKWTEDAKAEQSNISMWERAITVLQDYSDRVTTLLYGETATKIAQLDRQQAAEKAAIEETIKDAKLKANVLAALDANYALQKDELQKDDRNRYEEQVGWIERLRQMTGQFTSAEGAWKSAVSSGAKLAFSAPNIDQSFTASPVNPGSSIDMGRLEQLLREANRQRDASNRKLTDLNTKLEVY